MNKLLCSPPLISLISLKTILPFTTFFLAFHLFFSAPFHSAKLKGEKLFSFF